MFILRRDLFVKSFALLTLLMTVPVSHADPVSPANPHTRANNNIEAQARTFGWPRGLFDNGEFGVGGFMRWGNPAARQTASGVQLYFHNRLYSSCVDIDYHQSSYYPGPNWMNGVRSGQIENSQGDRAQNPLAPCRAQVQFIPFQIAVAVVIPEGADAQATLNNSHVEIVRYLNEYVGLTVSGVRYRFSTPGTPGVSISTHNVTIGHITLDRAIGVSGTEANPRVQVLLKVTGYAGLRAAYVDGQYRRPSDQRAGFDGGAGASIGARIFTGIGSVEITGGAAVNTSSYLYSDVVAEGRIRWSIHRNFAVQVYAQHYIPLYRNAAILETNPYNSLTEAGLQLVVPY